MLPCRVYSVYSATLPEWIVILRLAHEYQFPEVKRLAIHELESFDIPIAERIVLYQNHAVDPLYLVPLYVKMCVRDEGPSDEETTIMSMKTSLIIFRARERLRFRPLAGAKSRDISQPDENDITRTIYSLLGFDFNGQPTGSVTFTYSALPVRYSMLIQYVFLKVLPRRRQTTDVVTTKTRRVTLRRNSDPPAIREASHVSDQVQNTSVIPENEKLLGGNVASFLHGLNHVGLKFSSVPRYEGEHCRCGRRFWIHGNQSKGVDCR